MAAITAATLAVGGTLYSGHQARKGAKQAAQAQERMGQAAIDQQNAAQESLREDLTPYREFGEQVMPHAQNLFTPEGEAGIVNSPLFKALLDQNQRQVMGSAAAHGRLGATDTQTALQDTALTTGYGLLQDQRNAYLSALGIGQNASAQTGVSGVNTATNNAGILTDMGNSEASAAIAKSNANSQMVNGLVNAGGMLAGSGLFSGSPAAPGTVASDYTGAAYQNWLNQGNG